MPIAREREIHIRLEGVQKSFSELEVLKDINLEIQNGEFIAIVGESGCGKSTLLRLLAGLEKPSSGVIKINESPLQQLNTNARLMFQDGRLLPWKRVIDNVHVGIPDGKKEKAREALCNVGLENRAKDWPRTLSGGQKQRVALARALVNDPNLLLLDEPLGALDALTRIEMQDLIESLWQSSGFTSILVTHDVEEAVAIADRVILIENGVIRLNRQIDLERPRQRTNLEFRLYVEEIMDNIMKRKKSNIHPLKQRILTASM
ncbi:ATP-binding cassette domain-containing protein [Cerasibacillus terrae]|uniref:ATP-binding cassette domain-containing protein n=1 Tax=Cerasibacillus terrae TaxID=2498845 RepID=A0A5C8NPC1_9BACI|nr:ATP-binding cassette domain-containing protein [Cerasibacillus terrae]TXL63624.1 ATP-binding cassette domain-containing protein [Cerasibacillus terrae]